MKLVRAPLAALLAGALVLPEPGRAFAQVVTRAVPGRVGTPVAPVVPTGPALSPPGLAAPGLAPSLVASAPFALPAPTVASQAVPAATAVVLPAAVARPGRLQSLGGGAPSAYASVAHGAEMRTRGQSSSRNAAAQAPALESLRSGVEEISEAGRDQAGRSGKAAEVSARFFDGTLRSGTASPVLPEERPAPGRRPGLKPAVAGGAVAAAALFAKIAPPPAPDAGFWSRALEWSGTAGYWVGNALAFAFPIPQIYQAFRKGSAYGVPVWRAAVGMAASLALGLVLAPVAGQWFWGVQNIFGALTLIAPVAVGKLLRGRAASPSRAFWLTAASSLALLAPSAGLYFAAAAAVPAFLSGLMSAAAVCNLALGIQIATGFMYFLLFAPDAVSVMRGRAPKGFTSMVSFLFFVASAGFIFWTLQMAAAAPAGSAERAQFLVYAAQNAAYALVSFISFLLVRRQERSSRSRK